MSTQPLPAVATLLDALSPSGLQAERIAYLLSTLILLRWADFREAEDEAIAGFEDKPFAPVLDASFHWRSWSHLSGEELRQRLDDLKAGLDLSQAKVSSSHGALAYVWDGVHELTGIDEWSRTILVRWLAEQPFETPSDRFELLDQLDVLLDTSSKNAIGEFRTPKSISQLMVGLVAPVAGESVYDPCFGSAGLLTAAAEYVRAAQTEIGRLRADSPLRISGIEANLRMLVIGFARVILSGVSDPQLALGNSLERDHKLDPVHGGYDVILANPPFGRRIEPIGLGHYPVRTNDVTALFIQHALGQLKPGGRAAIVVPQGLLFRGGADREFRRWLMQHNGLEAVISLGSGAFEPYAGIQTSILLIRRVDHSHLVRFIDGESLFEHSRQSKGKVLSDAGISQIVEAFHSRAPSDIAWTVSDEEIARLEWDLTVKRRGQSDFHEVLHRVAKQLPVVPLGELAVIQGGISVKSQDMSPQPDEGLIPLLRTKDIDRGVASRASAWIPGNLKGVSASQKLQGGDILLSKSGTIGKSGIVRNGAVGALASSGLYRIHVKSEQIDQHYLLAFLNSPECRTWLSDQATGSTIQHLPIRVLRELPVPTPPLRVQRSIAEQFRDQETDALGFLALLSGASQRDPLSQWIESTLRAMPPDGGAITEPLNFQPFQRWLSELRSLRNRAAHAQEVEALAPWLLTIYEALSRLQGIEFVPKGASMLSIFQDAAAGLAKADQLVSGRDAQGARARNLTQSFQRYLSAAIEALASDVAISFSTEDSEVIWAGDYNLVHVKVTNDGALPLRGLQFRSNPDWGETAIPFLAEGRSTAVQFEGHVAEESRSFHLEISWMGESLDGRKVKGKREVAFEVQAKESPVLTSSEDIGASPYVCGDPVRPDRADVFFGREELLETIRRTVSRSGNVILLEGNRRAGKSSILWHLAGRDGVPGWLGVYCSLQGAEGSRDAAGVPTAEVFRVIASSIAKSVQLLGLETPLPNGAILPPKGIGIARACREGISEEAPFSDLKEYVEQVLELLENQSLGLLLMLDEFDKLQEGIENGVTSPQVPENIRFLVQSYPRFSAILTGSRRMRRLRDEYWSALYGLGTREGVTALDEEAARRLIVDPVKGRLTYAREAVDHLIKVSACQPFVLQCLCNRVFDIAADLKARTVSLELVKRAGQDLILGWEHFSSLWDYAGSDRRRFLLALTGGLSKGTDPVTLALLREHLTQEGMDVSEAALIEDIDFLRELELIDFDGHLDTYSLTIPLMGDWIEAQQDYDGLRTKARAENIDAPEEFVWTHEDEVAAQMGMFNVDSEAELEEFLDSWGD